MANGETSQDSANDAHKEEGDIIQPQLDITAVSGQTQTEEELHTDSDSAESEADCHEVAEEGGAGKLSRSLYLSDQFLLTTEYDSENGTPSSARAELERGKRSVACHEFGGAKGCSVLDCPMAWHG